MARESGQCWHRADHVDINRFRWGRECLECGHGFQTAALDEAFVLGLVELRDALAEEKRNAEAYGRESAVAAGSRQRLGASLSIRRALKICKKA